MYSVDIISKVRSFGALGYTPERIADILGYTGEERRRLLVDLSLEGSEVAIAYRQGDMIGSYNIDAELTKRAEKGDIEAIELLQNLKKAKRLSSLKNELFGL